MTESRVQRPTQTEAAYKSVSDNPQETCSECRFFDSEVKLCGLIENSGDEEITEKGRCDRWESVPGVSVDTLPEITEDKATEPAAIELPITTTSEPVQPKPGIVERIKSVFAAKSDNSPFTVLKSASGQHYWVARFTNHFEDRDKEIISSKAHEAYIARVNLGLVDLPELWTYHIKGTRHGQADMVWEHDGFVFALGHFDDTPQAKHAIKFYERNKGTIELSHGFKYPKWALKDGVYDTYNTFEITTLPKGAASNPYTTFDEVMTMAITEKHAEWIKSTLGEDALKRVQAMQNDATKDAEVLKALDAKYKDFADVTTQPTESKVGDNDGVIDGLLATLIATQANFAIQMDKVLTELESTKAEKSKAEGDVATLKSEFAQLKAQLDARPQAASTSADTELDASLIPAAVKNASVKRDPFTGVPVKE